MTYSHALRYLTAPDVQDPPSVAPAPVLPVKFLHTPLLLCFTRNKLGSAAASLLASVLKQAGIPYLHWIDDTMLDPKNRFLIDGRPVSPPLLAKHAALWQAAAREAGREPHCAERCAGILALCAAETECRVILLEAPLDVCHVGFFTPLNKRIKAITLLSDGQDVARTATNPATGEIITPAYGRAMHSRITDICAKNDSKMVTIATTAVQRESVTLGTQTVAYTTRTGVCHYRLPSASTVATEAAAIALYAVQSLGERGLPIPEDALSRGLLGATLSHCGTVYSAKPLILTHAASDEKEKARILSDLATLQDHSDTPLTLWAEPTLAPWPDSVSLYTQDEWPTEDAFACLLAGSDAWIEETLSARTRKKGKKSDKI